MTEGFLVLLFLWAVIDGDYAEATLIGVRWAVVLWRMHKREPFIVSVEST